MNEVGYILLSFAYSVIGLYAFMIIYAISGWKKLKSSDAKSQEIAVSILVAARNESNNIEIVLRDLFAQNYPSNLFEVIVINDYSEDDTLENCEALKAEFPDLKVLSNQSEEGKKAALQTGLENAQFEIIATVDADCRVGSEWLGTMLTNWSTGKTKMLLGPIVLEPAITVFERIQSLEMLSIMGLTGGFASRQKPIMANGANLFFSKTAFKEIGGYKSSNNPSGDDVFTMLKFSQKWPESVRFVKHYEAAISTPPQALFSDFWQQRKRWLSKKGGYQSTLVKATAIITYLANVAAFISLLFIILAFGTSWTDKLMWVLFIKTTLDLLLTRTVSRDLQPYCGIANIFVAEVFISVYVTFLGIFGNVTNYVWKGREVNVKARNSK